MREKQNATVDVTCVVLSSAWKNLLLNSRGRKRTWAPEKSRSARSNTWIANVARSGCR